MKKICKVLLGTGAFAVGFAAAAVIAGKTVVPVIADNNNEISVYYPQTEEMLVEPDYPINESGRTYGVIANVMPENYPDLIGVIATNGKEGYAYKEDFCDEYIPKSPEDAVRYMEKLKELNDQGYYLQVIPVYDEAGKTVIGEFEIGIDAGASFDGSIDEEERNKLLLEREKLYEESRKQGKVFRGSIKEIMEE